MKQDAQVESLKAEPMTVERRPTRPRQRAVEPADRADRATGKRYRGCAGGGWQADREVTLTGLPTPMQNLDPLKVEPKMVERRPRAAP